MSTTTTETLAAVRSRQSVWPAWMQAATAGLADTDLVAVTTRSTPVGNYVLDLVPVVTAEQ